MIIAGTGHRPNKLGGYADAVWDRIHALAISELQRLQPSTVISGMALGWDQAIAQAALDLQIPMHAYIPFEGQERMWPQQSRVRYTLLLAKASKIHVASAGGYAAWKMQRRNQHMVESCDLLLALWNGTGGGTANCVAYAQSLGRKIENCWSRF